MSASRSLDDAATTSPGPARPARLTIRFVESGDRLAFTYRRRGWGVRGFLVLWLIGWTVGCVFLARMAIREPSFQNILFGIPFWASWLFVFCWLLNMFLGLEYVAFDAAGVDFVRRVIVPIHSRHVPLAEIQRFDVCSKVVDSESNRMESGIEVHTLGRPLSFAWGLSSEELQWLRFQLNTCLAALGGTPVEQDASKDGAAIQKEAESGVATAEQPATEVLPASETAVEPPSDCRWQRTDDFSAVIFTQRGRFSLSVFLGLLFINAFWNGIVSVFVFQLWFGNPNQGLAGAGWWGLFVFLIPFEGVGLVMFLALMATLFEPLRRTSWRFEDGLIECRVKWLGLGPVRQYWVDGLGRIELVSAPRAGIARHGARLSSSSAEGADKNLVFIDKSNTEVCTMPRLTEGEARWISDTLHRERSLWFR